MTEPIRDIAVEALGQAPIVAIFAIAMIVTIALFLFAIKKMSEVFIGHNREIADSFRSTVDRCNEHLDRNATALQALQRQIDRIEK